VVSRVAFTDSDSPSLSGGVPWRGAELGRRRPRGVLRDRAGKVNRGPRAAARTVAVPEAREMARAATAPKLQHAE